MATGIHTGTAYAMNFLKEDHPNFPQFRVKNSSVIAIKDHLHYLNPSHGKKYDQIILIVRDPIEQAMSPSNFMSETDTFVHAEAPLKYLDDVYFEKTVDFWTQWHQDVIEIYQDKICVINFNELEKNLLENLEPCVEYLGFRLSSALKKCILKNQEGFHRRAKRPQKPKISKMTMEKIQRQKNRIFKQLMIHDQLSTRDCL